MGRHTSVIPEAPSLELWGVVTKGYGNDAAPARNSETEKVREDHQKAVLRVVAAEGSASVRYVVGHVVPSPIPRSGCEGFHSITCGFVRMFLIGHLRAKLGGCCLSTVGGYNQLAHKDQDSTPMLQTRYNAHGKRYKCATKCGRNRSAPWENEDNMPRLGQDDSLLQGASCASWSSMRKQTVPELVSR